MLAVAYEKGGEMKTLIETLQRSVTGKVMFVGLLTLLLLIPVGMIRGVIFERMGMYSAATTDVANAWGESQLVGAPILVVPFQYTRPAHAGPITLTDELYLLPETLELAGSVQVEERRRGIYRVPVYTARLTVNGGFTPPELDGYEDLQILWSQAQFALPLGRRARGSGTDRLARGRRERDVSARRLARRGFWSTTRCGVR